jgi:hypothetical protein
LSLPAEANPDDRSSALERNDTIGDKEDNQASSGHEKPQDVTTPCAVNDPKEFAVLTESLSRPFEREDASKVCCRSVAPSGSAAGDDGQQCTSAFGEKHTNRTTQGGGVHERSSIGKHLCKIGTDESHDRLHKGAGVDRGEYKAFISADGMVASAKGFHASGIIGGRGSIETGRHLVEVADTGSINMLASFQESNETFDKRQAELAGHRSCEDEAGLLSPATALTADVGCSGELARVLTRQDGSPESRKMLETRPSIAGGTNATACVDGDFEELESVKMAFEESKGDGKAFVRSTVDNKAFEQPAGDQRTVEHCEGDIRVPEESAGGKIDLEQPDGNDKAIEHSGDEMKAIEQSEVNDKASKQSAIDKQACEQSEGDKKAAERSARDKMASQNVTNDQSKCDKQAPEQSAGDSHAVEVGDDPRLMQDSLPHAGLKLIENIRPLKVQKHQEADKLFLELVDMMSMSSSPVQSSPEVNPAFSSNILTCKADAADLSVSMGDAAVSATLCKPQEHILASGAATAASEHKLRRTEDSQGTVDRHALNTSQAHPALPDDTKNQLGQLAVQPAFQKTFQDAAAAPMTRDGPAHNCHQVACTVSSTNMTDNHGQKFSEQDALEDIVSVVNELCVHQVSTHTASASVEQCSYERLVLGDGLACPRASAEDSAVSLLPLKLDEVDKRMAAAADAVGWSQNVTPAATRMQGTDENIVDTKGECSKDASEPLILGTTKFADRSSTPFHGCESGLIARGDQEQARLDPFAELVVMASQSTSPAHEEPLSCAIATSTDKIIYQSMTDKSTFGISIPNSQSAETTLMKKENTTAGGEAAQHCTFADLVHLFPTGREHSADCVPSSAIAKGACKSVSTEQASLQNVSLAIADTRGLADLQHFIERAVGSLQGDSQPIRESQGLGVQTQVEACPDWNWKTPFHHLVTPGGLASLQRQVDCQLSNREEGLSTIAVESILQEAVQGVQGHCDALDSGCVHAS